MAGYAQPPTPWDLQAPTLLETVQCAVAITPQVRLAIADATFLHLLSVQKWAAGGEPRYKESSRHWLRWQGSIYTPDQQVPVEV